MVKHDYNFLYLTIMFLIISLVSGLYYFIETGEHCDKHCDSSTGSSMVGAGLDREHNGRWRWRISVLERLGEEHLGHGGVEGVTRRQIRKQLKRRTRRKTTTIYFLLFSDLPWKIQISSNLRNLLNSGNYLEF